MAVSRSGVTKTLVQQGVFRMVVYVIRYVMKMAGMTLPTSISMGFWRLTSSLTVWFCVHHVFHTTVPIICKINQLDAWMNRIKIWWRGLSVVDICSPSKESLRIPNHCSPTIAPGHVWCHQMQGDFHQTLSSNGPSSCKQNDMWLRQFPFVCVCVC